LIKNLKEHQIIKLKRDDFSLNDDQVASKIKDADIVINLAGSPIIKRWTRANKKEIYNSRIITTSKLVNAISLLKKDIHLINTSAIAFIVNRIFMMKKACPIRQVSSVIL